MKKNGFENFKNIPNWESNPRKKHLANHAKHILLDHSEQPLKRDKQVINTY